jgi:hypothetical protein
MKSSSIAIKKLYPKINSYLGEIDSELKESIKEIKKEYNTMLIEEKVKLLKTICDNENLDFNKMKKYLSEKEIKSIKNIHIMAESKNEVLLDTINIDNNVYFYENRENGKIYDIESKIKGNIINGKPVLIKE